MAIALLATACADRGEDDADAGSSDVDSETLGSTPEDGEPSDPAAPVHVTAPGFDGLEITVGLLGDLSGDGAAVTGPVVAGHRAYWRYVNERLGGVGAQYGVEVRTIDAGADAEAAYDRARDGVTVFAHVGDRALDAGVAGRLRDDGIVASPGSRAARWTRDTGLLPVGAPEPAQVAFAQEWIERTSGAPLPAECVAVANGDTADALVADVVATGCEIVVLRGSYPDTATVVGAAARVEAAARWVLLADGWAPPLGRRPFRAYAEANVVVVQEETCAPACEPDRGATGEELADPWFRFGWTQARVIHAALEGAFESGDLGRASLRMSAGALGTVVLDGVMPSWAYADRRPPDRLVMNDVDGAVAGGLRPLR